MATPRGALLWVEEKVNSSRKHKYVHRKMQQVRQMALCTHESDCNAIGNLPDT